jgi:hypothetical protein
MLDPNLSISEYYMLMVVLVGAPTWGAMLLVAVVSWWLGRKKPRKYKYRLAWVLVFLSPALMLAFPIFCLMMAGQHKGAPVFQHVRYAVIYSIPSVPLGLLAIGLAYRLQQINSVVLTRRH